MKKYKYTGIIPPIVTPLNEEHTLDVEAFERLIEYDLGGGVSGFFVNGTSGEALRLSDDVWTDATQAILKYVQDRVPVFCGAIDTSTERVIERIKKIESWGGKIAVCTPPFYLSSFGQDEVMRHYELICKSSNIEIAIYNIPENTHVNILPDTLRKLADYDNIVAYKDSTADWQHLQRLLMCTEDKEISILNGAEELCAVSMLFGAAGCIPGLSNFMPKLFVELQEAALAKDVDKCYQIQKQINDIRRCIFTNGCWMSGMKGLLEIFQLGKDIVSEPLVSLTAEEKEQVKDIIRSYGY